MNGRIPTAVPRGVVLAGATATISGVSVYLNSFAVRDFASPALYTTAKNLVAAVVLSLAVAARGRSRARPSPPPDTPRVSRSGQLAGLAYVGVVGGGVAFILFFDGLAATPAEPAALLHDTLVVFVAVMAWPLLRER
ncbi:MAG TPA: EamA family transporter, partial [Acidimicrobiales bacterium]|nr:EamA family transporter [Acidimicrobiales bacterium]